MKKSYFCFTNVCCINSKNLLSTLMLIFFVASASTGFGQTNCNPDTEAPVAVNPPQDITVECIDDVPSMTSLEFTDNCDNDVQVFFHDMGPAQGSEKCQLSDAVGDGADNWALWLPNLPFGLTDQWGFNASNPGCLDIYDNGTAHITGRVYAYNNPSLYFDIDVWIRDKEDWNSWSSLLTIGAPFINRSFKDDANFAADGGDLWETWDYYVLDNSDAALIGGGGLAGSYITLEHAPANLFFGVQVGEAANNKNGNDGLSTWFTYDGVLNYNGSPITISGLGDFNFDTDCGPNTQEICEQEYTYTWVAIDDSGNVTTVSQTITVEDTTAPELSDCPEDMTVDCSNLPLTPTITATDNCDGDVDVMFESQTQAGDCPNSYSILNHWYAIDNCGNQVDCFQTITVTDNMAPVLSGVPADLTLECDEDLPEVPTVTASDNCDNDPMISYNETTLAGDCPNEMTLIRIWTAVDNCGNSVMAQQTITVQDTTNPTLSGVPADATVSCDNIPMLPPVTASDNCGMALVNFDEETIPNSDCTYEIVRTWTATDACGNQATSSQTITVIDETAPVFNEEPADMTVNCDEIPAIPQVTATDNCSDTDISYSETDNGENCPLIITRTWTATDECGNASSISQVVTVVDEEAPVLSGGSSGTITYECGETPATPLAPTAIDNCDNDIEVIETTSPVAPLCENGPEGIMYTWSATDECGNASSQSYTIQFTDSEAPVLSDCPDDLTIQCEDELPEPPVVTATDNCDDEVEVSYVQFINFDGSEAVCEASDAAGVTNANLWSIWLPNLPNGITDSFIWDENGGSFNEFEDYAVLTGTVYADNNPNQIFFVNIRLENKLDWNAWSSLNTISGFSMPRSFKDDAGFAEAGGDLWTTWDYYTIDPNASYLIGAGEFAGSMLSLTQAPANLLFGAQVGEAANNTNANYGMSTWFLYEGTLFGESVNGFGDVNIDLECGPGNQFAKCDYDITRIWIATDDCGNTNTCMQTINVIDTTAPEFNEVLEDETVECDEDLPAIPTVTATDNCGEEVNIAYDEQMVPGECPHNYQINRIWIATDCCGNSASISQTITVVDTTAPSIVAADDAIVECGEEIPEPAYTADDNCGDVNVSVEESTSPLCGDTYEITRIYTATDECGNSASDSQTITIVDTTAPELTVAEDLALDCTDDIPAPSYTASDLCGDVTVTVDESSEGDCTTTITRVYTAIDECQNVSTATQTITITDTTAPVLTVAPDLTLECGEDIPAPSYTANDDCHEVSVDVSAEVEEGCGDTFIMTRTYTATDECGNATSATQTITVVDTTAPSLEIPGDVTIDCNETAPAADYEAYDSCGDVTVSVEEEIEDTCGETYIITRTYTATDDCGNSTSAVQTITKVDLTPPVIEVGPDLTIECGEDVPGPSFDAYDDCGDVDVVLSQTTPMGCGETFSVIRVYTATDDCGNQATATQTITVIDTTAPTLTVGEDMTLECGSDVPAPEYSADDTCGEVTVVIDEDTTPTCGETYILTRTYIAFDECENQTVATQTITFIDTTAPELTVAEDLELDCTDDIPEPSYTASDSCGEVEVSISESSEGDCETVITRVYTAIDECQNVSTATQTITITDTTAPVLTVASDLTLECDEEIPAPSYTANDDCNETTVSIDPVVTPGDCPQEYTITRTYTATDACGNTSSAVQVINIVDTTAPTMDDPIQLNLDVDCTVLDPQEIIDYAAGSMTDEQAQAFFMYARSLFYQNGLTPTNAVDNCDSAPVIQETTFEVLDCEDVECPKVGMLSCTFAPIDACGNQGATVTTTISVIDEEAPVLEGVPADVEVECGNVPDAPEVSAYDNCWGEQNVTMTEEMILGDCAGSYTLIRTWTSADKCDNTSSASQTITVEDSTAPTFDSEPEDGTFECDSVPGPMAPIASDACTMVTVVTTEEITPGDCEDHYYITYTYTATDECENETSVSHTYEIIDTTAPVLDPVEPQITVPCDQIPDPAEVTATDNCDDDVTIMFMQNEFSGGCAGVLERIWIAKDNCGNESQMVQFVNLIDEVAPIFSEDPEDVTVECDEEIPAPLAITAEDNCTGATVTYSEQINDGDCPQEYSIIRTYTAIDGCENESSVSYTVYVVDTTAPVFTEVAADLTLECDEIIPDPSAEAEDNCGDVSIDVSEATTPGDCPNEYTLTRTYTANDECGNASTAVQTINVQDTTAPVLSPLPENVSAECNDVPRADDVSAVDNCDGPLAVDFSQEIIEGDCAYTYTIIRTWSSTDACGNTASHTQIVEVVDTTDPMFTSTPEDMTVECDSIPAPATDVSAEDNCDPNPTITFNEEVEPGDCPQESYIYRTWTATDDCGNSISYTQEITVVDTTAPVLTVAADVTIECDEDVPAPDYSVSDNCGDATVEVSEIEAGDSCELVITRTYTANDGCDNITTATQIITILDTTAPELTVAEDEVVECGDEIPAPEYSTADNCNEVSVSIEPVITDSCGQTYTMVRTYTATDICGNSTTATQTITVVDTTNPELEIPADITLECGEPVPAPSYEAYDICGDVAVASTDSIIDLCGDTYQIIRTYTAIDECGNSTSASHTITYVDTTAPSIEAADDMQIECGEEIPAPDYDAEDSCGDVTVTVSESEEPLCGGTYILTRLYTAEDECGNAASDVQVITLVDTTDPFFTSEIPADIDVECNEVPDAPELGVDGGITADDICSEVELSFNEQIIPGDCEDSYTIIRTWTVIDACDNMISASQTINVADTTPPVFMNIPMDQAVECDEVMPADMVTATDNCDNDIDIEYDELLFSGGCVGVLQRTWTATDNCGNEAVVMQFVTLLDNTPPVIEDCPEDLELECGDEVPAATPLQATDNCTEVDLTFEEETIPGECPQEYTIVRTWTATDNCLNSSTCTQTITISDNQAPEFVFVAEDATVECSDEIPATGAEATDNCGDVTITSNEEMTPGDCPQEYTLTITYTATDECGNAATAVQTINVVDTTAPEFEGVPADITVSCDEIPDSVNPDASDNCGEVSISFSQFGYNGTDCQGQLTRQWTATDECGNSTTVSQTITIIDTEAPVLSDTPENTVAECDSIPAVPAISATDNCDIDLTVEFNEEIIDGDCENSYTIERTWSVTDDCDNSASYTQIIDVVDTTAPVFVSTPSAQLEVECDDIPTADDLVATDNCDNEVEITYSEQNLSGGCAGTLKRTWVATDNCGNSSIFEQFLFLFDETAPEATVPADYAIDCDEDLAPFEDAMFTDNCSDVSVNFNESILEGDCPGNYFIIRTWMGTDECDNTTTVSQTITVSDNDAPSINGAPEDLTVECGNVPSLPVVTTSDNCGEAMLIFSESIIDGDCPESYTIVRTWTATDECGNTASVSQTINVEDTTAPVLSGNFEDADVSCDNVPDASQVSATDNCDADVSIDFDEIITPGACIDSYTITRTWTASDNCGNATTVTQNIEVSDDEAPIFAGLPEDMTVECDSIPGAASVTSTDNCDDDVDVTFSQFGYNGECSGTLNRVWTAIDNCGNTSTHTQVITVIDTTNPEFDGDLPEDMEVECDAVPTAATLSATDNCGDATVSLSEVIEDGDCENAYTIIRTWTAEDECENTTSHTQYIDVVDTTAPEFVEVPTDMNIDCQDTPDPQDVTVVDNCDNDVTVTVEEVLFSGGCVGVIERTYTAVDDCGNTSTYTQFITLEDNDAPVLNGTPADVTVECDEIPAPAQVSADDNCFDEVEVIFEETVNGSGCDYTIVRTWTAEDGCDNVASHTQTITVVDSESPVFVNAPADATVMCDSIPAPVQVLAADNCGDATVSMTEIETDGCPFQIIRTYTATDECDNTTTHVQTIDVIDETDPTFDSFPADEIVDCSATLVVPSVTASDNCDADVEVVLSQNQVVSDCETVITRTWMATDACGNSITQSQTVTLIDTTAPAFDSSSVPGNMSASCDDLPKSSAPTATDDCHDVEISFSETIENQVCPGTYDLIRTWTANDGCGNTSSVTQTISVSDNTAPEFIDFPADEEYVCGDDIPEAEMPMADDDCSNVTLTLEETIVGQTELNPACELTTPVDGVVGDVWSVFLPGVGSGNFVFDINNGQYQVIDLGGGNLQGIFTGRVYDPENPCYAFNIEGYMINQLDWASWSSMMTTSAPFVNRSFKDDGNFAAGIGGNVHETWEYWELSDETILVGDGCFDGDTLHLEHAPSNLFYGMQLGEAANNRNAAYGIGTWFTYSGELDGDNVNGIGDFAFELYCPPCEYTITRTWTAIDDCGNAAVQSQVINVIDPDDAAGVQNDVIGDLDIDPTFTDTPSPSKFDYKLGANPNPTSDNSTISFSISEDDNVRLEVYTMSGRKVTELYTGMAEKDQVYRFDFNAEYLSTGIYIYRLTTANHGQFNDKIIITK